jgi:hypothetical protein
MPGPEKVLAYKAVHTCEKVGGGARWLIVYSWSSGTVVAERDREDVVVEEGVDR